MSEMPSLYSFPCPHCGAGCPCPKYVVTAYLGRVVTRWCKTCRRLFHVAIPLVPPSEAPSSASR